MSDSQYQAKQPIDRLGAGGVANRVVSTADGVATSMQPVTVGMLAPTALVNAGRGVTKIVAASNAAAGVYPRADYICDGVADQVEINAALTSLGSTGGVVLLTEGTFTLSGPVATTAARQTIQGMGLGATTLVVVNAGGAPINTFVVSLGHDYATLMDLTIDGNKAQNATATSMLGVYVSAVARPMIQRVRVLNSAHDGIGVDQYAENGVVRDCLVETPAATGFALRSAALQRLIVSGCTAKGCGGTGFYLDNGPVALSACQALSCGVYGFNATSTALASLTACTAISSVAQGFYVTSTRARLTACRAMTCVNAGFETAGIQTQFVGCEAYGTTSAGYGFSSAIGAVDASYRGCAASNAVGGFAHTSAGRSTYVGCRALSNSNFGFYANNGAMIARHCFALGTTANTSSGVYLNGGINHVISGCRIVNHGAYGFVFDGPTGQSAITNNFISDSGLATNATYQHLLIIGDGAFVHGNMLRDPAAGNRPNFGIYIDAAASGTNIGHNDMAGVGTAGEFLNAGVDTKRVIRLALDYTASTDLMNGTALPASTWTDVCPAQTFRVLSQRSLLELVCRGVLFVNGPAGTQIATRLYIDTGVLYYLGGDVLETTNGQNALAGASSVKRISLQPGDHTIKLQVGVTAACTGTLRAGTYLEHLAIQVTELGRQ